jgi:hypothetical protein
VRSRSPLPLLFPLTVVKCTICDLFILFILFILVALQTIFCWEVRIDDFGDHENHPHKAFVGVADVGIQMDTICSKQTLNTDHVWGVYLASGKKVRKDKEQKIVQGIKTFLPGDTIGILIEIDREKSMMSVFKNGRHQGLAFRAMPRETTPIIAITGSGNQLSVVKFVEGENIFPPA